MTSGPGRIKHETYKSYLFSTDDELFKKTAAKVNRAVKIEGVTPKQIATTEKHWDPVENPTEEAQKLVELVKNLGLSGANKISLKEEIIEKVELKDVRPAQMTDFRKGVNGVICKDLVKKALGGTLFLEDIRELLEFVDSSKEQVDGKTFYNCRGQVMKRLCEKMPTSSKTAREFTVKALYASREHFHLGNIDTIKDPEIRKMCENLDKGIAQTLEDCIEHECTKEFIDEYLGAMADAVKFINSASAYIGQAPEEKKQVLQSTNKILEGILHPGKKGWFSKANPIFEKAKGQVTVEAKRLDLMTQVKAIKGDFPEEKVSWNTLEKELHSAKDLNRLEQIEEGLNDFISQLSQGPTDSSKDQVTFQAKRLDLMTQVKVLKENFPEEEVSWNTLEKELHSAKDLNRLKQIEEGLNNFISELSQGPTDSSSDSDHSIS